MMPDSWISPAISLTTSLTIVSTMGDIMIAETASTPKPRISSTMPQAKGNSRARTFYVVLFVGRPILPEEELYLRNNYNKMQVHLYSAFYLCIKIPQLHDMLYCRHKYLISLSFWSRL